MLNKSKNEVINSNLTKYMQALNTKLHNADEQDQRRLAQTDT